MAVDALFRIQEREGELKPLVLQSSLVYEVQNSLLNDELVQ